jgi:hypothetical protein
MTRDARRLLLAVLAFATGIALFRRRPVKTPEAKGNWRPAAS